jgi:dTDP-glucose 4,6-dehydratase
MHRKNLLITGGAGFIGANFVHYWSAKYPQDKIMVLDKLTYAGRRENIQDLIINKKISFVKGDICNHDLVPFLFEQNEIDTVVHFAAESHVDRSISDPQEFVRTNVLGTLNLLEAAKNNWHNSKIQGRANKTEYRFHHVSTDEVYGMLSEEDPPFTEMTPYAPSSPYSASKAASDHLVRSFSHTYGLPISISNCSNNYGPYHFPEKLIPLSLTNLLLGKKIGIYGDGRNIRDWLFVTDHCYGIDLVLNKGKVGQTYNIGGNNEIRNIEIIHMLCDKVDTEFKKNDALIKQFPAAPPAKGEKSSGAITFIQDRPGHDWRYAIDATKVNKELGYLPQEDFSSGLDKTIKWFLHNESWWKTLITP